MKRPLAFNLVGPSATGESTAPESWIAITRSLLHSELFRIRKRPLWWILLLLDIGSAAAFYASFTLVALFRGTGHESAEFLQPQRMMESSVALNAVVVGLSTLVFAATSVGNEFSWGTMRPLIARSGGRSSLLTAKWTSVAIVVIVLQVIGFLACLCGSVISTLIVFRDVDISSHLAISLSVGILRLVVNALPITAIGLLAALMFRSSAAGIGAGVGLVFLEPAGWAILRLVTDALEQVRKFGISYPTERLLHYALHDTMSPVGFREGVALSAICLTWTALAVTSSYILFRKRDITG